MSKLESTFHLILVHCYYVTGEAQRGGRLAQRNTASWQENLFRSPCSLVMFFPSHPRTVSVAGQVRRKVDDIRYII